MKQTNLKRFGVVQYPGLSITIKLTSFNTALCGNRQKFKLKSTRKLSIQH